MPAPTSVTTEPDTVQTVSVVEAKDTDSPEEAVALSAIGVSPKVALLRGPKVIVCDPTVTVKLWLTEAAAL